MLVLTRRIGESILIGDRINLMVLGIRGSQVRLGFDEPKDVTVHRSEIHERIQQEKISNDEREGRSETS